MLTIVPSKLGADRRIDRAIASTPDPGSGIRSRASWSHDVMTLRELVSSALTSHPSPRPVLSNSAQTVLVDVLVDRLEPEVRSLLGPGLSRTGTTAAIARVLAHVRQAGLTALDLARASGGRRRLRVLAAIIDSYERSLTAHHVWDDADRVVEATRLIEDGTWRPHGGEQLVIDGLYDATRIQSRLLRTLALGADTTLVRIPFDPEIESLTAYAFPYIKMWEGIEDPASAIDLAFFDRADQSSPTIEVFSSHDAVSEARDVAGWVRRHIDDGTKPGDIVIVAAGGSRTAALLLRELERLGVPGHAHRTTPLSDTPLHGALMAPFQLMEAGFDRVTIESWVSTPLTSFDPDLLRLPLRSAPPSATEPGPWKRALAGVSGPSAAALNSALDRIHTLSSREHAPADFWDRYESILDTAGSLDASDDLAETWDDVSDEMRLGLETLDHWSSPPVGWRTHRRRLVEALAGRRSSVGDRGHGVAILTPYDARGVEAACCAVVGVAEGAYARPDPLRVLLGDGEREHLNAELGRSLFRLAADEMREPTLLLLDRIRATASHALLTYARQDEEGNPQLPSHALDAVVGALGIEVASERASDRTTWRIREPREIVRCQEIERARADYFARPVSSRRGSGDRFSGDVAEALVELLEGEEVRSLMTRWSASRLETLRQCPHKYFMRYVLGVALPESQPIEAEATTLGSLAHEALRALYEADPDHDPEAARIAAAVAEAAAATPPSERGDPDVWPILMHRVERDLVRYASHLATATKSPGRPVAFELSFGDEELEAIPIEARHLTARLTGRVDRIDRDPETGSLHVVDYKYSLRSTDLKKAVDPGTCGTTRFQLWVYMLGALEWARDRGFPTPPSVTAAIHSVRAPAVFGDLVAPPRPVMEAAISEAIGEALDGRFDPSPSDAKACRYCDFKTSCRIASGIAPAPEEEFVEGEDT